MIRDSTQNSRKYHCTASRDSQVRPVSPRNAQRGLIGRAESHRAKTAGDIGRTYTVIAVDKLSSFLGFGEDKEALEGCKCLGFKDMLKR